MRSSLEKGENVKMAQEKYESFVSQMRYTYKYYGVVAEQKNVGLVYRWYFDGKISFDMRRALLKENEHLLSEYVHNKF